jgi:hypothetical protein
MNAKHTPGPWEAGAGENDGRDFITIEHDGCPLCQVRGTNDMSCIEEDEEPEIAAEMVANARLIAAAPDLLESLQWLVGQIGELKGDISLIGMGKCLEAIKKATE